MFKKPINKSKLVMGLTVPLLFLPLYVGACEKVTANEIKKAYFDLVAQDIEKLGLFCVLEKSINPNCDPKDAKIMNENYNSFVKKSSIGIINVLKSENFGNYKICTFKLKKIVSGDPNDASLYPSFDLQFSLKTTSKFGFENKEISIIKESWKSLHFAPSTTEGTTNMPPQSVSPYTVLEDLRRFSVLNRFHKSDKLTSKSINNFNNIPKLYDRIIDSGAYDIYYKKNY
jgi:hypothetical protein